jgi:hypothetical protein
VVPSGADDVAALKVDVAVLVTGVVLVADADQVVTLDAIR